MSYAAKNSQETPKDEIDRKVNEAAAILGLEDLLNESQRRGSIR